MSFIQLPAGYPRIQFVSSFAELISARFGGEDGVNAFCWPRELSGDFGEVVAVLEELRGDREAAGLQGLDEAQLRALPMRTEAGRAAVEILIEDWRRLRELGLEPNLDCIRSYPRDEVPGIVPTDVYSWHVDSATVEADTWLCTYFGATSEGLRQEDAIRCVDVPELRAALLGEFGGGADAEDDLDFREYLHECCYDLHYDARPGSVPFVFGIGNFWRIAAEYPGSPVPACVHRAPENEPGEPARLLLIS